MIINKDSLKARANNLAKELNIDHNTVYNRFFFDAFLSRLASSKYKDKFILKGGLYLSSLLGIDTRVTIDIDFYLRKLKLEKNNILKIINEVSAIDIGDGIRFKVVGLSEIRVDDIYGGFQIKIVGHLDNVKYLFCLDVATGDPIVPSEKGYDYKCLVSQEIISLKAYSLESVIAEKLQTILVRGITNSRSKDYYDLFILSKTQKNDVDFKTLKEAFKRTCEYRKFKIDLNEANEILNELRNNLQIKIRWNAFSKKNNYSKNIDLSSVIDGVQFWINHIF